MKFGYFNQLQMPKPWPENAEAKLYKEAMDEAVLAEEVGFEYYWQTEHHFYPEIGHSSAPELFPGSTRPAYVEDTAGAGCGGAALQSPRSGLVEFRCRHWTFCRGDWVEMGTGRGASVYHSEAFGYDAEGAKELWGRVDTGDSLDVRRRPRSRAWKGTHYDPAPAGPGAQADPEAPPAECGWRQPNPLRLPRRRGWDSASWGSAR